MVLQVARFLALLLASLGLVMGGAHALESPVKMRYDADMYRAVTSSLYHWFGLIGGFVQVGALAATTVLAVLVRRRSSFRWTLSSAVCLVISLGLWAALVQPVNSAWSAVLAENPSLGSEAYMRLRERWEYGHLAAFLVWLLGVMILQMSVVREIPACSPTSSGPVETIADSHRPERDSRRT